MKKVYVLQVMTGMEQVVADLIEGYGLSKIGRVYVLRDSFGAALFPGYVFVEMALDGDTYRPVLDTPFVVRYLCPASGVRPLCDLEAGCVENYTCRPLMPGLPVEVVEGELSGLRGELRSVDFPRITMVADIYGEAVEYTLNFRRVRIPGLVERGLRGGGVPAGRCRG